MWPVELLGRLLPRHLEIIYRINAEFLDEVRAKFPDDEMRVRRMSIIADYPERGVRMAYLATVAATKVNGVAALHSELLRDKVLPDFSELWPEKFTNVTNGVTPRRFLRQSNPKLSELITEAIGGGWVTDLERLQGLEPLADDADFRARFREVKQANKARLFELLKRRDGYDLSNGHMLDVMVKRLHEYKRQIAQAAAHRHPVRADRLWPGGPGRHDAAHIRLRRQGRPGLSDGQGDHLPDQLGGLGGQCGSRGQGRADRRLPGQLQRHPGRDTDPGGGSVRADLARRQGGLGYRQHEVRPQRRA